MRLLPRISTTVSLGSSTSVICSPNSMSRIRALRLSTTLFSCPEYVWMKNHCFIMEKPLVTRYLVDQPCQPVEKVLPPVVDGEQIDREEDDVYDHDDSRILDVLGRRERRAVELFPGVADEISDAFLLFTLV